VAAFPRAMIAGSCSDVGALTAFEHDDVVAASAGAESVPTTCKTRPVDELLEQWRDPVFNDPDRNPIGSNR
jgi:hypothetical protein